MMYIVQQIKKSLNYEIKKGKKIIALNVDVKLII